MKERIKIGYSLNPAKRRGELKYARGVSRLLRVLAVIPGTIKQEKELPEQQRVRFFIIFRHQKLTSVYDSKFEFILHAASARFRCHFTQVSDPHLQICRAVRVFLPFKFCIGVGFPIV